MLVKNIGRVPNLVGREMALGLNLELARYSFAVERVKKSAFYEDLLSRAKK